MLTWFLVVCYAAGSSVCSDLRTYPTWQLCQDSLAYVQAVEDRMPERYRAPLHCEMRYTFPDQG